MTARYNEVERNRDQERCAQYQVALQESGPTELVEKCSLQQRDGGMQHAFPLLERTFLYQFSWPRLLQSHLILGAALLISVALNLILAGRHPKPQYFAMDAQGRIVALVPLAEP